MKGASNIAWHGTQISRDPLHDTKYARLSPGWAVLFFAIFASGLILYSSWPRTPWWVAVRGFWVFFRAFCVIALFYVAAAFLMTGKFGVSEVRNRLSAFSAAVVIAGVAGGTCLDMQMPIRGTSDVPWALAWHHITHSIAWGFQPLMAGIAVHSALYAVKELPRLPVSPRNTVASYLVVTILAVGLSALTSAMLITQRALAAGNADLAGVPSLWTMPDAMTRRYMAECPGDYHFVLLRANFLMDRGRSAEASPLYNQLRQDTNTPRNVQEWVDRELSYERHPSAGDL